MLNSANSLKDPNRKNSINVFKIPSIRGRRRSRDIFGFKDGWWRNYILKHSSRKENIDDLHITQCNHDFD